MLMLALVLAAATPPQQPWLEMQGGPVFLHQGGRAGVGSGPLLRIDLGMPLGPAAAAELWMSGAMESAPLGTPGDEALVAGGAAGRLLVAPLLPDGKLGLWAHAGVGWAGAAAGDPAHGPTGFAGALLAFQPFVKRFSLGIEGDAVAYRNAVGLAVLPSLRCAF